EILRFGGEGLELGRGAAGEDNVGAGGGQREGHGAAEPAPGAGDEGDAAREVEQPRAAEFWSFGHGAESTATWDWPEGMDAPSVRFLQNRGRSSVRSRPMTENTHDSADPDLAPTQDRDTGE